MHQLWETNSVKLPEQNNIIVQPLDDSKMVEQFLKELETENVGFLCY